MKTGLYSLMFAVAFSAAGKQKKPAGQVLDPTAFGHTRCYCVDASDPSSMKVHGPLGPSQWFAPITSRYLAGWRSPGETTHFQ